MRLISFGTERYPEKIARRLRALNIAVWITTTITAAFGFARLFGLLPRDTEFAFESSAEPRRVARLMDARVKPGHDVRISSG